MKRCGFSIRHLGGGGAALIASLWLAGCSSSPRATYDLTAAGDPPQMRQTRAHLAVLEPFTVGPIDTDRIVIRTGPDQLAYLADAQWTDRLPRLVQARLVETFENGRPGSASGRTAVAADFDVLPEVRRFEIDVAQGLAIVEISVKVTSDRSNRVVAARVFSASVPAPSTRDGAASLALDEALSIVLRDIIAWTNKTL
jgi:cholesterol transport system auxiliary component